MTWCCFGDWEPRRSAGWPGSPGKRQARPTSKCWTGPAVPICSTADGRRHRALSVDIRLQHDATASGRPVSSRTFVQQFLPAHLVLTCSSTGTVRTQRPVAELDLGQLLVEFSSLYGCRVRLTMSTAFGGKTAEPPAQGAVLRDSEPGLRPSDALHLGSPHARQRHAGAPIGALQTPLTYEDVPRSIAASVSHHRLDPFAQVQQAFQSATDVPRARLLQPGRRVPRGLLLLYPLIRVSGGVLRLPRPGAPSAPPFAADLLRPFNRQRPRRVRISGLKQPPVEPPASVSPQLPPPPPRPVLTRLLAKRRRSPQRRGSGGSSQQPSGSAKSSAAAALGGGAVGHVNARPRNRSGLSSALRQCSRHRSVAMQPAIWPGRRTELSSRRSFMKHRSGGAAGHKRHPGRRLLGPRRPAGAAGSTATRRHTRVVEVDGGHWRSGSSSGGLRQVRQWKPEDAPAAGAGRAGAKRRPRARSTAVSASAAPLPSPSCAKRWRACCLRPGHFPASPRQAGRALPPPSDSCLRRQGRRSPTAEEDLLGRGDAAQALPEGRLSLVALSAMLATPDVCRLRLPRTAKATAPGTRELLPHGLLRACPSAASRCGAPPPTSTGRRSSVERLPLGRPRPRRRRPPARRAGLGRARRPAAGCASEEEARAGRSPLESAAAAARPPEARRPSSSGRRTDATAPLTLDLAWRGPAARSAACTPFLRLLESGAFPAAEKSAPAGVASTAEPVCPRGGRCLLPTPVMLPGTALPSASSSTPSCTLAASAAPSPRRCGPGWE
uniref:C2 NT-type domain-containing protein n=1 Tax=Macrostomum lignano TaxID=282301 RepID=A0A1I8FPL1_9PLAT